jgi:hypothetical protein
MQQRSLRSVSKSRAKRRLRLIHANVRSTIHRLGSACLYRKLDSTVMVMKSADDRHRYDAAYVLDGAMDRSVFAKRPMSPQLVIISGILRQDPA